MTTANTDRLSDSWSKLQGGDIGGFRITNWCLQLLDAVKDMYDLVVFDVGPSLGALNRTVILASDFVVTPFGCDIFSLLGIRNISSWIKAWDAQYMRAVGSAKLEKPRIFSDYQILDDTSKSFRFIGYSVQQYVTRTFKTGKRPVKSYETIMKEIPETVADSMGFLKPDRITADELELRPCSPRPRRARAHHAQGDARPGGTRPTAHPVAEGKLSTLCYSEVEEGLPPSARCFVIS